MLDLTTEDFVEAATIGLGRAILFVRQTGGAPNEDIVRHVLLHSTAYDPQIEGTHAWYVFQLISATDRLHEYLNDLQRGIKDQPSSDSWDEYHRLSVAARFAEAGYPEMRQLIYDRISANIAAGFETGIDEIIMLDGMAGLEFAIDRWDRAGLSPSDLYDRIWYLEIDGEALQNLPMVEKLRQPSDDKPVRKQRSGASGTMSYEDFRRAVASEPERWRLGGGRSWARKASDEDILKAAIDFLAVPSDDHNRILCYLSVFSVCPYPLDPAPLIAWAGDFKGESPWTERDLIPERMIPVHAFMALRQVEHEAVRTFALDWVNQGNPLDFAIDLFERNYRPGDWVLIAVAVRRDMDREALHGAGMGVHRVFQKHPDPESVPALRYLVEHGPCSHCRLNFLQALHLLDELPELLQVECYFDSNEDIRMWANETLIL